MGKKKVLLLASTILIVAMLFSLVGCSNKEGSLVDNSTNDDSVVEIDTDLLVVGGGGAGMTATVSAAAKGLDVVLIEKNGFLGGSTGVSSGGMVVTGSNIQKELGVTEDTPESMIEDFLVNGENLNDQEKLEIYANSVGDTVNWLIDDLDFKMNTARGFYSTAEYAHDRVMFFEDGASGLVKMLKGAIEETNAKVMLDTKGEELIVEDGVVNGIKAVGGDGKNYRINAKAVLLATGGFGNNVDMLSEDMKTVLYYGLKSSTGDGHLMAKSVNAKFQLMEYGKLYSNGIEIAERTAKSTSFASQAATDISGILINKEGNRIVNEKASNKEILDAQFAEEDKTLYMLMDSDSFEAFLTKIEQNSISQKQIDTWLANNGSIAPIFANADTLEEVAEIAGINVENLKTTVEKYNKFVANASDTDFGRPVEYLKDEIGEGPYYIVEQKPRFATTMGGVVTNENLQIINEDGQLIKNLYAAGELAGGVSGNDSPPGANVGWALTSGRLAGLKIAEALGK